MLRTAFAFLAATALIGCSRPPAPEPIPPQPSPVVPVVVVGSKSTHRTPDSPRPIATTIERIGADYKANEVRADATWKGKRIVVTVSPVAVVKDKSGTPIVIVSSKFRTGVNADMAFGLSEDDPEVTSIEPGKPVRIEGTIKGISTFGNESFILVEKAKVAR